ncbi:MAG TPA: tetratricopeptide repeat protein [Candidatus Solibacter sp.]|nr:tetratricopeptide repeat protein [Candidatus Solibacter sp.]
MPIATAFAQGDEWWRLMKDGIVADQAGDYVRSATLYREAIRISERFAPSDERSAYAWNALAKTQDVLGNYAAAERGYRHALRAAEDSRGRSSIVYAIALENLAILYAETGQASRGERLAREALSIVTSMDPPERLGLAMAQNCLATITGVSGKHEEAIGLVRAALPVLENAPEAWTQTVAALNTIAVSLYMQGERTEPERLLQRALTMAEGHAGGSHPMLPRILMNLAAVALQRGHREEAGARLSRAMEITAARLGTEHPAYGSLLGAYAVYLRQVGEKSRAREMEARSNQILKDNGRRNGLGAVIDVTALQRK